MNELARMSFDVMFMAPSTTPQCVLVHLIDDSVFEGAETFSAVIGGQLSAAIIGTQDTTVITITDSKFTHTQ